MRARTPAARSATRTYRRGGARDGRRRCCVRRAVARPECIEGTRNWRRCTTNRGCARATWRIAADTRGCSRPPRRPRRVGVRSGPARGAIRSARSPAMVVSLGRSPGSVAAVDLPAPARPVPGAHALDRLAACARGPGASPAESVSGAADGCGRRTFADRSRRRPARRPCVLRRKPGVRLFGSRFTRPPEEQTEGAI